MTVSVYLFQLVTISVFPVKKQTYMNDFIQ